MNLKSIEYFLITVEEMNFTRAAGRLYISQQALSSHISRLEEEYGIRLFERRPALSLTPEGEEMYFYGSRILEAERKLRAAFSDIRENCRATMRVGISRLRGEVFFPNIWKYFHASHPNITIDLIDGNSEENEELLLSGKLDLFIGVDIPPQPNLCLVELAREKVQCCLSRTLLQQYYPGNWEVTLENFKQGIDLSQIMELPFITVRQKNRLRKALDYYFTAKRLKPRIIFESNQQELAYELCKSGAGVGLLSPLILYQHLDAIEEDSEPLYVFPLLNELHENIVSLAYRKDYPLPRHTMEFISASCMVFRNYSNSIRENFSPHSGRRA